VISHLFASILGAAFGTLGLAALFVLLVRRGAGSSAVWAFALFVIGNALATSVFGAAAFAQPAIGRMYLAGQTAHGIRHCRGSIDLGASLGWDHPRGFRAFVRDHRTHPCERGAEHRCRWPHC